MLISLGFSLPPGHEDCYNVLMGDSKDIIFIGDSLIEWFDWLQRFPAHRVQNLGISGETVEMLLDRLCYVVEKHPKADMVFLMTGINNVAMEDADILSTYKSIVKHLREGYPEARIHLTSLLPTLLPWVEDKTITNLNALITELAGDMGAHYDDIYSLFKAKGVHDTLSEDGIHISARGYKGWADALEPAINA